MSIPSAKERPDLYDDYDGRQGDEPSSVQLSPRLQQLLEGKQGDKPKPDQQQPKEENPA